MNVLGDHMIRNLFTLLIFKTHRIAKKVSLEYCISKTLRL